MFIINKYIYWEGYIFVILLSKTYTLFYYFLSKNCCFGTLRKVSTPAHRVCKDILRVRVFGLDYILYIILLSGDYLYNYIHYPVIKLYIIIIFFRNSILSKYAVVKQRQFLRIAKDLMYSHLDSTLEKHSFLDQGTIRRLCSGTVLLYKNINNGGILNVQLKFSACGGAVFWVQGLKSEGQWVGYRLRV